jgi:nucleotide-binding universal stress UspA family protein
MLPLRRILHPTDFSEQSQAAFGLACALARDYSAELEVMHVHTTPVFVPDGIAIPVPAEDLDRARVQLHDVLPKEPGVKVKHVLSEGNPVDEILERANKDSVDLIVMGTHGTGGLTRLLIGSVAESITRKASCPVLTIRKPMKESPKKYLEELRPVHNGS